MKKYLVTPFSEQEITVLKDHYQNWDFETLRDLARNASAFELVKASAVDTIYVFAKSLKSPEEFWWIFSANVFVTKGWAYGYDSSTWEYVRMENWSEVQMPRIEWFEKEFLAFFKAYLKAAFDVKTTFAYDFRLDFFWTKRFSSYWGKVSWCDSHVPKMALPLISKKSEPKIFRNFLSSRHWLGKDVVLKIDGYSWGRWVFAFDLSDPKDSDNLLGVLTQLKESWKTGISAFERLDVLNHEIRILWTKSGNGVKIVEAYKRKRLEKHIVHIPSDGGSLEKLSRKEMPKRLISAVEAFCGVIIDNHGWLDVLVTKKGGFYFTENNVLTGYLSQPGESEYLRAWLDAVSETYA